MDLLLVAIDLKNKPCIIIGGGGVAERKAGKLIKCGGAVTVISPDVTKKIKALAEKGALSLHERRYKNGDIIGAFLVVIATSDSAVNMRALSDAEKEGALINAAFSKQFGNTFFTATRKIGDVALCAITDGFSPKKSKAVLDEICKKAV